MRTLPVAMVLLLVACAPGARGTTPQNASTITRTEIEAAHQVNALELIQAERPHWLRRRGARSISADTDVVIYLDGTRFGGPEALASLPTINIEEIRHYTEAEAQYKYGVGHIHGAIDVITRRGG